MAKQPHLLVGADTINETVLLPGDPDRVTRIAEQCEDVTLLSENREYRIVNATYDGVGLTICSTGIGSPSAAVAVEELIRIGAKRFLRVGTAGGLQQDVDVGDLVVATGAAKDEGTTKRYESATIPAVPDHRVVSTLLERASEREPTVHTGPIVTDDAFYAETDEYVEQWEAAGMIGIEMEAAAIFSLARRAGLAAGAICTIDGNLVRGAQKGETDEEELPEETSNTIEVAITIALEAAARLEDSSPK